MVHTRARTHGCTHARKQARGSRSTNEPYGFCGRKATLNHTYTHWSQFVPNMSTRHPRTLSSTSSSSSSSVDKTAEHSRSSLVKTRKSHACQHCRVSLQFSDPSIPTKYTLTAEISCGVEIEKGSCESRFAETRTTSGEQSRPGHLP